MAFWNSYKHYFLYALKFWVVSVLLGATSLFVTMVASINHQEAFWDKVRFSGEITLLTLIFAIISSFYIVPVFAVSVKSILKLNELDFWAKRLLIGCMAVVLACLSVAIYAGSVDFDEYVYFYLAAPFIATLILKPSPKLLLFNNNDSLT